MTNNLRTKENFDNNWLFHLGDIPIRHAVKGGMTGGLTDCEEIEEGEWHKIAYFDERIPGNIDAKEWAAVSIPHDWCVEGNFVNDGGKEKHHKSHGYLPVGIGCYRKEFSVPQEDFGRKISLEFDGVMRNSTVWVNGHLLGNHASGYTGFNYDITDIVRYGNEGENVVFVKVDATDYEGWWYEGCGIYRHVWLVKTERLHVARHGTYVTTPEVREEEATVHVKTRVLNELRGKLNCRIETIVVDVEGNEVARHSDTSVLNQDAEALFESSMLVKQPKLWSPEQPYLYEVLTEIHADDQLADQYRSPLGIRTIEFNAVDGFLLNGKPYLIKGTCNHQDFAGVGVALPNQITEYKLQLLKDMGSNAYRCSHHAPAPELLEICDRIGMLVVDENRKLDISPQGIADLKEIIYRDRNHPSVFMWCMENEEILEGTIMGTRMVDTLSRITHSIDPTRPTIACMNHGWNDGGYSEAVDIVGYNYGQREDQYIRDRETHPNRLMLGSESTSCTTTRGIYENDAEKGYCSSYGDLIPEWSCSHEKSWQDVVNYPYLSGVFVWTGFDYRGEPTPYSWPCINTHFGIMDTCGFPKDAYYYYKAAWTDEPVVHILPHWNWSGKEGQEIEVWTYSNCESLELLLNGRSLGEKAGDRNDRTVWNVIYEPGELVAVGIIGGKEVTRKAVVTASHAATVQLSANKQVVNANGTDVVMVQVAVLDDKGNVVPTADNEVRFAIEGPGRIIGVGNGDPSSHEPDKASRRRAFNGHCLAIIQASDEAGEIKLTATSTTLKSATVKIDVS
ncbi:beta-galactosidase GalA [Sporosarcina sp. NPDC096371]|uniref:beta-galactosidase GalA n=1 Tax=Sporosarcina sp. NPDC096371 TaxID=3364530 RepID=UPI00381C1131